MIRLALALPLVCLLLVASLWAGESLRAYRSPANSPAPTDETSRAAAASPALQQQPAQFIKLPAGVSTQTSSIIPSPDGEYLVGRTTDFTQLAFLRVHHALDTLYLETDLLFTAPIGFIAWMPDGRSFVAQGTTVVNTSQKEMKLFDVVRVDLTGTQTKLGEARAPYALSPDGKLLATFDGNSRLVLLKTDSTGTIALNDPAGGSAEALLGWDAGGTILRADYRPPFSIHRIPLAGAANDIPVPVSSVYNARWSPDRRAALVTAQFPGCECDGILTDHLERLPADAFPVWVGPHSILTRGSDQRAGTLDVITGTRTTLNAKMRSDKIRIFGASLPYVMWLDEVKGTPHVLDLGGDRDTGVGLNPSPGGASPISHGRFYVWRDKELQLLDAAAWWRFYVDAHPTPSPEPVAKDQSGVPAGYVRIENPEGGWSVVIPKSWYRRVAPMHGTTFFSYDPEGMDFSGNLPPAGNVSVTLEMPPDYGATDLRGYASGHFIPFDVSNAAPGTDTTLAGMPAYTFTAKGGSPSPWDFEKQLWVVRSPFFLARVVVVQVAPNARTADVDSLLASLRFFKPVTAPVVLKPTRPEVIAQYSKPTFSATRVDRVDVKLVRWIDYEKAAQFGRSGTNDPDELTWVVVVYGEIQPPNRGLVGRATPAPGATSQTFHYEIHAFSATGGEGGMYSCCGPDSAPSWWDTLVDLGK